MERFKKFLPLLLFSLYFGKTILKPASFIDTSVLLVLGIVSCYFEYKINSKEMKELNSKFDSIKQDLEKKNQDIENLKGAIGTLKLGNSMRSLGGSK